MYIRILILSLVLLSGCITVPNLNEEQKFTKISLEQSTQTALADPLFEEGEWPSENWWEMFNDPQLNLLVDRALQENPTMQQAFAKMQQAWQMAKIQQSYLWPELNFSFQDNWQYFGKNGFYRSFAPTLSPSINQIDLDFNLYYEVDFWGKNRRLFHAALGKAKAESAEFAQTRLIVSTAVALAYFDLQTDLKKLQIVKELKQSRSGVLNLTELRQTFALSTETEKIDTEKPVLDVDANVFQYEQLIALDKHLLAVLLGRGPDDLQICDTPSASFERAFPLPEQITLNLLSRRPDLMAQIWHVEAAAQQIGVAKTYFYPNVTLSAFGGFETLNWGTLFSWNSKMGSVLPALTLPIFNAGRIRANVNVKEAEYDQAVYAYNETLLNAAKEVADQIVTFRSVNAQKIAQDLNLKALTSKYDLSTSRYIHAVASYLEVLSSQESVLNQRLLLADLEHARLMAILKLIKALGGGYDCSTCTPLTVKEAGDG